jgi:hypothetical protein
MVGRNVSEVTMPEVAAPQHAQNRSLFYAALQVRTRPSAVTIHSDCRLSLVSRVGAAQHADPGESSD